jgi:uroporphyrin-III C-methyltransferase
MQYEHEDSRIQLLTRGRVYLVGAGPGDPDLLTVRADRILSSARVVAYDELVSPEILAIVPADAERIAVGRRRGTCPDAPPIHPAVVERALSGHDVVRLKGGDPMIFGRGGEEAEQLAALKIPFEIVPGISAALGAASATGIPLTHRAASSSVTFATAHLTGDARAEQNGIAERVPEHGTVVLYMGLATLRDTARELVAHGRSPAMPVAVIARATLPDERVVISDLAHVADDVERAELPAPALVIIGDVVGRRVESASLSGANRASRQAATTWIPAERSPRSRDA